MARKAPRDDVNEDGIGIGSPKEWAAGIPGVTRSLRTAHAQMGVGRTLLTLAKVNQKEGFDCPGCAWPEGEHRSPFEFCENGAKAVAEEATVRRVTRDFFARHSRRRSAPGAPSTGWASRGGSPSRCTGPRAPTTTCRSSWDDAFALIARQLRALDSPDEALFYTSGRTSNEAAFAYQLLVRRFGTNNLPDCSNMCHESSGSALTETLGIGKGTVSLEDLVPGRSDLRGRPEPRHQPSAHALRPGEGQGRRRPDHRGQPAARGRAAPLQEPAAAVAGWWARVRRCPTGSCRSGSTATSRSSRPCRCCCWRPRRPLRAP